MLYISRFIGLDRVGVVDTDDGSEEVCNSDQLMEAKRSGLKIQGMDLSVIGIAPWQNPKTRSAEQVKLEMMGHVHTVVYDDEIELIRWEPAKITTPIRVRLSALGSRVGDFILRRNTMYKGHKVTLVFDDRLKSISVDAFSPLTYQGASLGEGGLDVRFDVTGLEDNVLAKLVYRSLIGLEEPIIPSRVSSIFMSVIDSEARKKDMLHFYLGW